VQAEVDGRHLRDTELIAFLVLLFVAGNETTTNLINHAVRALVLYPSEQRRLRERPELMPAFLEEVLRWESPIQGFYRRARKDTEIGGVQVEKDQALLVLYGAANHDPAKYECPAEVDGARFAEETGTRDHLAFGAGIHYCLGANLARIGSGIAVGLLLERFSEIKELEGFEPGGWARRSSAGRRAFVVSVTAR